jgi:DNA repair protein NreA
VASADEIKKKIEQNWIQFLHANSAKLSLNTLLGATPPSVFVGRFGYPKVKVGPMLSPLHGNTKVLDTPEMWIGKNLGDIINYRLSLIRGVVSGVDVRKTSGKYIESLQELSMSNKSANAEAVFEKQPVADLEQGKDHVIDLENAPFGLVAPLRSFKTSSSLSADNGIENAYYDKDLPANQAIVDLYQRGIEVSRIQRVLSVGMLGLQKNRRLVPTRWSVSATDDVISSDLVCRIESYQMINLFEAYKYSHIGNYYSIILIPDDVWNFEMHEAWSDSNGNLGMAIDFEDAKGLDHYPSIAGAYFAAKLGVAEHLFNRRRKAAALVLREIRPEYVMPVGVWQIREGVREALKGQPSQFDSFEKALDFVCIDSSVSSREWISNSVIYKNMRQQRRITDFIKGDLL